MFKYSLLGVQFEHFVSYNLEKKLTKMVIIVVFEQIEVVQTM